MPNAGNAKYIATVHICPEIHKLTNKTVIGLYSQALGGALCYPAESRTLWETIK